MMSTIIEHWNEQTLESRKRLDNIREVEQENLKMNRAPKLPTIELSRKRN